MQLHRVAALIVALILVPACTSNDAPTPDTTAGATSAATDSASPAGPGITANPQIDVTGSCTRQPQQDASGTFVTAELKVRNTGNIGAQVRVAAVWPVDRGQRLARTRSFKLRPDKARDLNVRVALTPEDAAGITNALEQGRRCRFSGRVVGAFGRPVDS